LIGPQKALRLLRSSPPPTGRTRLSFPSQLKACEHKVVELGGEVTCRFTDQFLALDHPCAALFKRELKKGGVATNT
jgi:hypothetical protein